MKKALKAMAMLLFVVSMTTLTSCNKEAEKLIVGKWECTTATFTEDGVTQSVPWVVGMVWEFKANGDIISTIPDDLNEGDDETVTATYVVLDDILTITSVELDGEIETTSYIIKELAKSKLVLEERDDNKVFVLEFKKII
jgi:hypothetical protein